MHQAVRRLVEIPLQVADQARTVVDDAHQEGFDPFPLAGQHLARAVVEVKMPERSDVLDLVAAYFQVFEAVTRGQRTVGGTPQGALARHAARLEEAPQRRVGRQRAARQCDPQVVVVELGGPARMLAVLRDQRSLGQRRQTGEAPDLRAQPVGQCGHRIAGAAGRVVPAFQGGDAKVHVQAADRVAPGLGSQCAQGRQQVAGGRWRGE